MIRTGLSLDVFVIADFCPTPISGWLQGWSAEPMRGEGPERGGGSGAFLLAGSGCVRMGDPPVGWVYGEFVGFGGFADGIVS